MSEKTVVFNRIVRLWNFD